MFFVGFIVGIALTIFIVLFVDSINEAEKQNKILAANKKEKEKQQLKEFIQDAVRESVDVLVEEAIISYNENFKELGE